MECRLEDMLTRERTHEMDRYGRREAYHKMQALLTGDRLRSFNVVNHGLAMVDDVIDSSDTPLEYLARMEELFRQSFSGAGVEVSTSEEHAIVDLGHTLNRLASGWFTDRAIGKHTYIEVLNYWDAESKNLQRRGQILYKQTLDEITAGIGAIVASQLLFIIDPPRDPYEFLGLAKSHGMAVKLADNLCDFREDIRRGYINIPREEIHHLRGVYVQDGLVTRVDTDRLSLSTDYLKKEYKRIQQVFASADYLLLKARAGSPMWNRKLEQRLDLFGQICHSWLNQVQDFMDVEPQRNEYRDI